MASRRSSQSSAATFFLADWRFALQWAAALVVWAFVATAVDFMSRGDETGSAVLPLTVLLATHLAAVLLLVPFSYLFLLTGRCLLPGRRPLLPRLLALALWSFFVLLLVGSGREAGRIHEVYWSSDPRQGSWGLYMAGAVALAVGGGLVTSFRFLSEARNALAGILRLLFVVAVAGVLFLRAPVMSLFSNRIAQPGVLPELRLVLILEDFDFAAANRFLADAVDESWRSDVRSVRPVALPVATTVGQFVTLFTGLMPYEHGLRGPTWSVQSWKPVDTFWQQRREALAATSGLHATNVPHAGPLDLFFGQGDLGDVEPNWRGAGASHSTERGVIPGVRCPDTTRSQDYFAFLSRMKERVLPFDVQDLLAGRLPAMRCLTGTATVEDIIHEEFASALMPAWRRAAGSQIAGTAEEHRLFSFWSLDLARLGGPWSAADDEVRSREQGQRLLRLLGQLSQNVRTMAPGAAYSIHVVGLSRESREGETGWGSYVAFYPGQGRTGTWPLPNENLPVGLEDIGDLAGFAPPAVRPDKAYNEPVRAQVSARQGPRVFYQEAWSQSEPMAKGLPATKGTPESATARAVGVHRGATCFFWGQQDTADPAEPVTPTMTERYMSLSGSIEHLAAEVRWSTPMPVELAGNVRARRDECEEAIRRTIQDSIDRDVHLLEPYRLRAAEDMVAEAGSATGEVHP